MGISDAPADEQQGALDSPKNNPDGDGKALFPAYSKDESAAASTKMVAYFKVGTYTQLSCMTVMTMTHDARDDNFCN